MIDLWSKMLIAAHNHDEQIISNVENLQREADAALRVLHELLQNVHALSHQAVNAEHRF